MNADDITVTIRVKDEATPTLRRIARRLWWMQYGPLMLHILIGLLAIVAFILGRITA